MLKESGVDIDVSTTIRELEEEMLVASNNLEFEKAALLRDQVRELKRALPGSQPAAREPINYAMPRRRGPAKSRRSVGTGEPGG